MTTAIRILAYGISSDLCGEYIEVGEHTAIQSLKIFCDVIIALYVEEYQCSLNKYDITRLLREGVERGFPGMLGSIDCMHWEWKNCLTAWHDTHKGRSHKPTLILEAVTSKDLWIWHAFFGMAGSHNDLNVLDHSLVLNDIINGTTPLVNYEENGHRRTLGYYLADGIYLKCATLMHIIMHSTIGKEKLFAQKQEAARKDVERVFGVLQIRWAITQAPVRYWEKKDLNKIMRTCIILHNIIIKCSTDIFQWAPLDNEDVSVPHYDQNPSILSAYLSSHLNRICNRNENVDFRRDLVEYLWNKFGNEDV